MRRIGLFVCATVTMLVLTAVALSFTNRQHGAYVAMRDQSLRMAANAYAEGPDEGDFYDPPPSLGGGADVGWLADGADDLDRDLSSPTSTIVLRGRPDEDLTAIIRVSASIGSIAFELFNAELDLPAAKEIVIPLTLEATFGVHQDQVSYPTVIRGAVAVRSPVTDRTTGSKLLDPRFLVLRDPGMPSEIYDPPTFKAKYPYGVTNPTELDRMLSILKPEDLEASGGFIRCSAHVLEAVTPGAADE